GARETTRTRDKSGRHRGTDHRRHRSSIGNRGGDRRRPRTSGGHRHPRRPRTGRRHRRSGRSGFDRTGRTEDRRGQRRLRRRTRGQRRSLGPEPAVAEDQLHRHGPAHRGPAAAARRIRRRADPGHQHSTGRVPPQIAGITDGRAAGLVAHAGVSAPGPLSPKINYVGTVRLIEALRPLLVESGAPRISVTTSAATLQGNDEELVDLLLAGDAEAALARGAELAEQGPAAGYANYSSSKRAISRWIRRVAPTDDYAGLGIGINGVGPGQVRTAMTKELFSTEEGRRQAATAMPAPFNGPADAEDIAAVHAFLVSAANSRM